MAAATAAARHIKEHGETRSGAEPRHPQSTGTPVAEEENPCKVDLRIQGVPPDAVLEEQERMPQIQELFDK